MKANYAASFLDLLAFTPSIAIKNGLIFKSFQKASDLVVNPLRTVYELN